MRTIFLLLVMCVCLQGFSTLPDVFPGLDPPSEQTTLSQNTDFSTPLLFSSAFIAIPQATIITAPVPCESVIHLDTLFAVVEKTSDPPTASMYQKDLLAFGGKHNSKLIIDPWNKKHFLSWKYYQFHEARRQG